MLQKKQENRRNHGDMYLYFAIIMHIKKSLASLTELFFVRELICL